MHRASASSIQPRQSSYASLEPRRPRNNPTTRSLVRRHRCRFRFRFHFFDDDDYNGGGSASSRPAAGVVAATAASASGNNNNSSNKNNNKSAGETKKSSSSSNSTKKKKKWGQDDWRERIASARPGGAVVSGGDEIEQLLEERRRRDAEAEFYADGDSGGGLGEGEEDEIVGSFALDDVDDDDEEEEDFIFIPDEPDDEEEEDGKKKSKRKAPVGTEEVVDLFLNPAWGLKVLSDDDDDDDVEQEEEQRRGGRKGTQAKKEAGSSSSKQKPTTTKDDAAAAALAAALGLRDASALDDPRSALSSIPKHVLAKLAAEQSAAVRANRETAAALRARKSSSEERKLHRVLRLLGGKAAGVRLLSSRGENTRPMMEKVRAALFDMLLSRSPAGAGKMPRGSTWLDLFAGTGSVGLEAVSRGAAEAHFVECEPWVVRRVLGPNIESVARAFERSNSSSSDFEHDDDDDEDDDEEWDYEGDEEEYDDDEEEAEEEGEEEEDFDDDNDDDDDDDDGDDDDDDRERQRRKQQHQPPSFSTTIHPTRAEQFVSSYRGRPFDFISVCPPYVKVSYTELLGAMHRAATGGGKAGNGGEEANEPPRLFHDGSVVIVEYPGRASREIPRELGPLVRVRDRRYGRTNVAIYGPRG